MGTRGGTKRSPGPGAGLGLWNPPNLGDAPGQGKRGSGKGSRFDHADLAQNLQREAGIGGTVVIHVFIDTEGQVQNVLVHESSGHPALDAAAGRVALQFEFSPALNRDQQVPVWISLPITFEAR